MPTRDARCFVLVTGIVLLLTGCPRRKSVTKEEVGKLDAPIRARIVKTTTTSFDLKGVSKGLLIPTWKEGHDFDLEIDESGIRLPLRGRCDGDFEMAYAPGKVALRCGDDATMRWSVVLLGSEGRALQSKRRHGTKLDLGAVADFRADAADLFAWGDSWEQEIVVAEMRHAGGDERVADLLVDAAPALARDIDPEACHPYAKEFLWRDVLDALPPPALARARAGLVRTLLETDVEPLVREGDSARNGAALFWPTCALDLKALAPQLNARVHALATTTAQPRRVSTKHYLLDAALRRLLRAAAGAPDAAALGADACLLIARDWPSWETFAVAARQVVQAKTTCPALWTRVGSICTGWKEPDGGPSDTSSDPTEQLVGAARQQPGGDKELALRRRRAAYALLPAEGPTCERSAFTVADGTPCRCPESPVNLYREACSLLPGERNGIFSACAIRVDDTLRTITVSQSTFRNRELDAGGAAAP